MANRWSTEHMVTEHRDLQASAMAVDHSGQLALLAGKRSLAVVNLNNPTGSVQKVPRQSKWEINAVQWNPHASHAHHFIAACNQRADIWTWDQTRHEQKGSLKAHTRVISDVDWSPFNPQTVATCSVDTFTFLWDVRDIRKPTLSLQGISGASQVKWNKVKSHLLATCHDGDIRIWDPRKGNSPVQYIPGHLSKIFGLDWCPYNENHLATSSQDSTVKFWDISNPRQSIDKLTTTGSPVWRARYTPFGTGLVTVVVPQLRRGENSLFLWNYKDLQEPVHTFVGHTDVVLEFQWRNNQQDAESYQLVTWSKDHCLRLWTVDHLLQKMCGADIELECSPELLGNQLADQASIKDADSNAGEGSESAVGDPSKQEVSVRITSTPPKNSLMRREENLQSPQQPKSLQQEFTLVNFDNVTLDETDVHKRTCTVSAESSNGKHQVKLTMIFPDAYPNNAQPTFRFVDSNIEKQKEDQLITALQQTASQYVKYSRSCIDPCLRQLATQLNSITEGDKADDSSESSSSFRMSQSQPSRRMFGPAYSYISFQDQTVPFPRTSGARFCSNGVLVCFTRMADVPTRRTSYVHPRAMAELSAYIGGQGQSSRTPATYKNLLNLGLTRSPPSDTSNLSLRNYYEYKDMFNSLRDSKKKQIRSRSKTRHSEQSDSASYRSPKKEKTTLRHRVGPVVIYDVYGLMPLDATLAEKYVLDSSDLKRMCTENATLAASVGRSDLVQLWSLLSVVSSPQLKPSDNPDREPFANHPFGRQMLKSLIEYYTSIRDVQTLAMVTCALGSKFDREKAYPSPSAINKSSSDYQMTSVPPNTANYKTYHTVPPSDTSLANWAVSVSKMKRSSSLSDMLDDYVFTPQRDPQQVEREMHQQNSRLLELSKIGQYDQYKFCYADMLYRMGFLNQRALVLKYVSTPPEPHKGIEFVTSCHYCGNESRGAQCWHSNCKRYAFRCEICHISVKGSASFCLACGHGGHTSHMMEWFKSYDACPTGCGCKCLENNPMSPDNIS